MIKGTDVILKVGGDAIAASTSASISLSQELIPYEPLPGEVEAEEAKWEHYRTGQVSWNVSNDGFFTTDSQNAIELLGSNSVTIIMQIDGLTIEGTGHCTEIGATASVNELAKLGMKIICDEMPTLTT